MVKQVTSLLTYVKEVEVNGRQELVEVTLNIMRMKEWIEKEWRTCMEVNLKLVDMESKVPSAEELVQHFEVLRDIWFQLAQGLQQSSAEE